MYTSIYFYRVPKENIEAFLRIQTLASDIYKKYGAIDDWTFGSDCLSPKYGCTSVAQIIPVNDDDRRSGAESVQSCELVRCIDLGCRHGMGGREGTEILA